MNNHNYKLLLLYYSDNQYYIYIIGITIYVKILM